MYPTLINIFGVQITTYGLMVALAFATMYILSIYRGKKLGYPEEFIQNLLMFIVLGSFVFARLLHVLTNWEYYSNNPADILFSRDGFVFLGGFIGGVGLAVGYSIYKQQSILGMADLFAPFLALAQGIGRIGCFLYGCCFGDVCSLPWAARFPYESPAYITQWNQNLLSSDAVLSLPIHPTQIYHSLFNVAHFGILLLLLRYQTFKGQIGMAYLIIYSTGRFVIEYFRGDNRGELVGYFSTSQEISILLFCIGLTGYLILQWKNIPPDHVQKTSAQHEPSEANA